MVVIVERIIRVIVVDDSLLVRQTLHRLLELDPEIKVVATAGDAYEARDLIVKLAPDVITLDIEMPKMNGIDFLKKLIPQYPIPVVVCSSLPMKTFDALEAGAVDFVKKPVFNSVVDLKTFGEQLSKIIKQARTAKVIKAGKYVFKVKERKIKREDSDQNNASKIIAIGGSTGATEALPVIFSQFDENTPPCVVVIHMPEGFTKLYAERLNRIFPKLAVMEAQAGMYLKPGMVVIAPGGKHIRIFRDSKGYFLSCFVSSVRLSAHCPSVDVMFESAAVSVGSNVIGVLLTGMGSDGAKGLMQIRNMGGYTIGQNEESCVVYGMPRAAFDMGAVCTQVDLEDISDVIFTRLKEK